MDRTSKSDSDHEIDSVTRLRDYVREHKLQRGEDFVDVNDRGSIRSAGVNTTTDDNSSIASLSPGSKPRSKSLSNAAKHEHFMDNRQMSSSSSSSSIYSVHDYNISYPEGHRPSFLMESNFDSKVSLSSEDEEDELPLSNLVRLILEEQGLADDAIYNDWDSGLSHSSIELNQNDSFDSVDNFINVILTAQGRDTGHDFPHRALRYMECQICLEKDHLRRRMCCDFQICNKCLRTYLSGKVTEGKVQIECANDRCNALMFKDEIRYRLPIDLKEKFATFLIDANKDPYKKTCPSCSLPYEIDPAILNVSKKKLKHGVKVTCGKCRIVWCFRCQAPFHSNMTCKKYRNEDDMVKRWAKGKTSDGQTNAQKCPKCKIFVQKTDGCDHMKCTQCETNFCYKCGDRYISVKFFGSHWNRFSLFGCKYRLMPEKNGLRRFIRGSHFVGRVLAAVIFAGLGLAAGAVLVAGSVVILPGYGIFLLRRRMWAAKQRKKFDRVKMRTIALAEKQRVIRIMQRQNGNLETVMEESETETLEQISDPQQVQVIVHQHEEEALGLENLSKESDIIINKYTSEDSNTTALQLVSRDVAIAVEDDFVTLGDIRETSVEKRSKLGANIVPSTKEGSEEKTEEVSDSGIIWML